MTLETGRAYASYSIRVQTPDGEMFVHIAENNGVPCHVHINIGKAGTNIAAWGDAMARLVSKSLETGTIYQVIEELSGITTAKVAQMAGGGFCRSGPEGLAIALLNYRKEKFKENNHHRRPGGASLDP